MTLERKFGPHDKTALCSSCGAPTTFMYAGEKHLKLAKCYYTKVRCETCHNSQYICTSVVPNGEEFVTIHSKF